MKEYSFSLFDTNKPKFNYSDIKIDNIHYEEICGKMPKTLIVKDGQIIYKVQQHDMEK